MRRCDSFARVAARLDGKVAFVTGGNTGIGAAIARRLAFEGAAVAVAYHEDEAAAHELVATLGRAAAAVPCDVAEAVSVAAAVDKAASALGPVTVLVNNAAVLRRTPFLEIDDAEWDRVLRVALYGAFHCARAVVPGMLSTELPDGFVESVPLRRLGLPDDVAGAVAFLASDDAAWVTGRVVGVNGGLAMG